MEVFLSTRLAGQTGNAQRHMSAGRAVSHRRRPGKTPMPCKGKDAREVEAMRLARVVTRKAAKYIGNPRGMLAFSYGASRNNL
jgi:hypothetical protein